MTYIYIIQIILIIHHQKWVLYSIQISTIKGQLDSSPARSMNVHYIQHPAIIIYLGLKTAIMIVNYGVVVTHAKMVIAG